MAIERDRTLVVLRHAKAAGEPGASDVERPLTARGRHDAAAAGAWLLREGLAPDRVLCSSAVRTMQTWQHVSAAMGPAADRAVVSYDPRVYEADAVALLELIRENSGEAGVVLVVGHNPASHQLAADLSDRPDLAFPTCALAVIRVRGSWAETTPGTGELAGYWTPDPRL